MFSTVRYGQPKSFAGTPRRGVFHVEFFGYHRDGDGRIVMRVFTHLVVSFSQWGIALRKMYTGMFCGGQNGKIAWPIVSFIAIKMMHGFISLQLASEHFFRDGSISANSAAIDRHASSIFWKFDSMCFAFAQAAASVSSGQWRSFVRPCIGREPLACSFAAKRASEFYARSVDRLNCDGIRFVESGHA